MQRLLNSTDDSAHMRRRVTVVGLCVCLSVKSHLTSGSSVHPENTVTYSADNEGQKICGFFSETAPFQRSSTLKAIHMVGHFPVDSAHAHYMHMVAPRVLHFSAFIVCVKGTIASPIVSPII